MTEKVSGMKELQFALSNFVLDMDVALDDAVRLTAIKVNNSAIRSIREPSIGEQVTRYRGVGGNSYTHTASKEGDAPNSDTGRLVNSVQVVHNKGDKVAFVGTNVDYGFFLETVQGRPWLEPAKDAEIKDFAKNVTQSINVQIKKAGK